MIVTENYSHNYVLKIVKKTTQIIFYFKGQDVWIKNMCYSKNSDALHKGPNFTFFFFLVRPNFLKRRIEHFYFLTVFLEIKFD